MQPHKVVSEPEWIAARKVLLVAEKELSKARDRLNAERRALPWVKVETDYLFDGPGGRQTLGDLFAGRSQLIIYHFMFAPDVPGWPTAGCPMCSFLCDHIDGALPHLEHHDVTVVAVSRAPRSALEPYRTRMNWHFNWVSSGDSNFNRDYHVSFSAEGNAAGYDTYNYEVSENPRHGEAHGISVFYKDESGDIFHTYSSYARGGDLLIGAYNYIDLTPKGRAEKDEFKDWVRRHDEYERR